MSFYVNFCMILVILRKFLRARIAYIRIFLYLCTLIVKYSENDNVFCNLANRTWHFVTFAAVLVQFLRKNLSILAIFCNFAKFM